MSAPADIMAALGRHDAAAALRWSEEWREGPVNRERVDALEAELITNSDNLEALESLLCKRCTVLWNKRADRDG